MPPRLIEDAAPGVRVKVPLRNGSVAGYLAAWGDDGDGFAGPLADVDEIVSPVPVLAPEVLRLARAIADRSAGTASDVIRLAVPKRQVRLERAELARRAAEATDAGGDGPAGPAVAPTAITGYDAALTAMLEARERISLEAIARPAELPTGAWVGGWAVTLAEVLLTASASGGTAIAAVPDRGDLDQLAAALAALDPTAAVARVDAKQSSAKRYQAFLDALAGRVRIVIGNRSALYAPASTVSVIVVWEDGDPLHAEPLAPYASAREVALVRREQSGAALVFAGHTTTTEVQRLVEIGFLRRVEPAPVVRPRVVVVEEARERIPSSVWQRMRAAVDEGPVLVQVARPVEKPGSSVPGATADAAPIAPDIARTAAELGRALPRVAVVQSHGAHRIDDVDRKPRLVLATRGAEPIAAGGYRAVLLLDARRMLSRESLRVGEDCLRWWSQAAALAAPKAPVFLVGVGGLIAEKFALWRQDEFASAELADRRALDFPPAVRLVVVSGARAEVEHALEELRAAVGAEVEWPVPLADGGVRGAARFEYRYGGEVAGILRAAVLRNATGRAKGRRTLRVRFDDRDFYGPAD